MYRRAKELSTIWKGTERETSVSITVCHLQGMFLCGLECRISHTWALGGRWISDVILLVLGSIGALLLRCGW